MVSPKRLGPVDIGLLWLVIYSDCFLSHRRDYFFRIIIDPSTYFPKDESRLLKAMISKPLLLDR